MDTLPKTGADTIWWFREQLNTDCLHVISWVPRDTMKHRYFKKSHFKVVLLTFYSDSLPALESMWA